MQNGAEASTESTIDETRNRGDFLENNHNYDEIQHKTRKVVELLFVFLALLFLSSCSSVLPQPQEMGNMALLRTFGADLGEDENWLVTVSTGAQPTGLDGAKEPPIILQAESASLEGASHHINSLTQHTIFYGYVDQLLIGDDLAQDGILHLLEYFSNSQQLSLGTGIWLCDETANALLSQEQEEGTEPFLATITEESRLGTAGITRKVGEVLSDIKEDNGSYIPILGINDQNIIQETGYGILKGESLVALFQGELATGLSLLEGHNQLQEFSTSHGVFAFDLSQIKVKYQGDWHNQKLNSVDISLEMQGELLEYPKGLSEDDMTRVRFEFQSHLAEICNTTILNLQNKEVDPLHIQNKLAFSQPMHKATLSDTWDEIFSMLKFTTSVKIDLVDRDEF